MFKILLQKYSAPCASDFDVCAKRVKLVSETDKFVFETDKMGLKKKFSKIHTFFCTFTF